MGMICHLFPLTVDELRLVADELAGWSPLRSLEESGSGVSLEKSWHGLHFALTGDPWGGEPPLNFLLAAVPVGTADIGYGPPRVMEPSR